MKYLGKLPSISAPESEVQCQTWKITLKPLKLNPNCQSKLKYRALYKVIFNSRRQNSNWKIACNSTTQCNVSLDKYPSGIRIFYKAAILDMETTKTVKDSYLKSTYPNQDCKLLYNMCTSKSNFGQGFSK